MAEVGIGVEVVGEMISRGKTDIRYFLMQVIHI